MKPSKNLVALTTAMLVTVGGVAAAPTDPALELEGSAEVVRLLDFNSSDRLAVLTPGTYELASTGSTDELTAKHAATGARADVQSRQVGPDVKTHIVALEEEGEWELILSGEDGTTTYRALVHDYLLDSTTATLSIVDGRAELEIEGTSVTLPAHSGAAGMGTLLFEVGVSSTPLAPLGDTIPVYAQMSTHGPTGIARSVKPPVVSLATPELAKLPEYSVSGLPVSVSVPTCSGRLTCDMYDVASVDTLPLRLDADESRQASSRVDARIADKVYTAGRRQGAITSGPEEVALDYIEECLSRLVCTEPADEVVAYYQDYARDYASDTGLTESLSFALKAAPHSESDLTDLRSAWTLVASLPDVDAIFGVAYPDAYPLYVQLASEVGYTVDSLPLPARSCLVPSCNGFASGSQTSGQQQQSNGEQYHHCLSEGNAAEISNYEVNDPHTAQRDPSCYQVFTVGLSVFPTKPYYVNGRRDKYGRALGWGILPYAFASKYLFNDVTSRDNGGVAYTMTGSDDDRWDWVEEESMTYDYVPWQRDTFGWNNGPCQFNNNFKGFYGIISGGVLGRTSTSTYLHNGIPHSSGYRTVYDKGILACNIGPGTGGEETRTVMTYWDLYVERELDPVQLVFTDAASMPNTVMNFAHTISEYQFTGYSCGASTSGAQCSANWTFVQNHEAWQVSKRGP